MPLIFFYRFKIKSPDKLDLKKFKILSKYSSNEADFSSKLEFRDSDSKFYALITPKETGECTTHAYYDNKEIKGSPFKFQVSDELIFTKINGSNTNFETLDDTNSSDSGLGSSGGSGGGVVTNYPTNKKINFEVDVSKIGKGKFHVKMVNLKTGEQFPVQADEREVRPGVYDISFMPTDPGTYKCMIYYKNKPLKSKLNFFLCFILLQSVYVTVTTTPNPKICI